MILFTDTPESEPSNVWVNVLVAIVAVLILLAIILVPIIRRIVRKKKGITTPSHCASCSSSKTTNGKSNLKKQYDKKHKKDIDPKE